ncbi:unnamed protein product [Diplocarpon coronariae]
MSTYSMSIDETAQQSTNHSCCRATSRLRDATLPPLVLVTDFIFEQADGADDGS